MQCSISCFVLRRSAIVDVHVEQLSVTHRELLRVVVLLRGVFPDSVMAIPGKSLEPIRCTILAIRLRKYMHMHNT